MSGVGEPEIIVEGVPEVEASLSALLAGVSDLRPFWPLVVPLFVSWMREQFGSEGAWGGDPWKPLSPAYLAWKMEHYPGKPILQATGALRRSASEPGRIPTARTLTLTINDPKAQYHQSPTVEGRPPRREIIPDSLPLTAVAELDKAAETYVFDLARRLGLETPTL